MPYIRDSFWRGRQFTSVAGMQNAAVGWCREVAGRRAHRGLDGAAPAAVFAAVEAVALQPLPVRPFERATWSTGKVGPDVPYGIRCADQEHEKCSHRIASMIRATSAGRETCGQCPASISMGSTPSRSREA